MPDLTVSWQKLLHDAIHTPGRIHQAYSRFHNYSIGNQLLALFQCSARGLQPGPIATFPRWKELGRFVRKGEKAITLCMPVTCKAKHSTCDEQGNEAEQESCFTRFVYRNNWFVLAQTEGAEFKPEPLPHWDESRALATLAIERIGFDALDGNTQGYATGRKVAINPVAAMPAKTLFHELAHVILGHTAEASLNDGSERTPRSLREVEAESVALLCCESLGLPGAEFSRGYIQSLGERDPRAFRPEDFPCRRSNPQSGGAAMIRWPDYKEAVAWLKANAQGPTGFYLWGNVYVRRALWDGFSWRWLTEEEQRELSGVWQ